MKFSLSWLNEYLLDTQNSQDLANVLTLAGIEVDAVEPMVKEISTNIVVGQIKVICNHPNADKLKMCTVDVGQAEFLSIVCGASNIYEGMKIPVAKIGAILPGNFKIKKSTLRGQESFGMMCSEQELGLDGHADGLMDLPMDATLGEDINKYLCLDDNIIGLDLTPNRADCLSIYGIAREVSALTKTSLTNIEIDEPNIQTQDTKKIRILENDSCKSYYGCIIKDVDSTTTTPLWMREKLRRSGVDSISLLVDVTNYVMLLVGQPMHVFDLGKLSGDNINIRFAKDQEQVVLLNGAKIKFDNDILVVADDKKILAIAGVMGGLDASVTTATKSIFLESAFFVPEKISGKARKYNLHTNSSHRFERGVDPKLTKFAMKLAIYLITNIAGGKVGEISSQEDVGFLNRKIIINLCVKKLNKILGTNFNIDYITNVLNSLRMHVEKISEFCLKVIPPSYRFDIKISEDLIEEVARVYGYSNLPMTMPKYRISKISIPENQALDTFENRLIYRDYHEVINYSFIASKYDEFFFKEKSIAVQNPISQDLSMMRQSLIPGLLNTYKANLSRQQDRIRIFEKGNCFKLENNKRFEFNKIAGLAYGGLNNLNWRDNKKVDFFDVKADVEILCEDVNKLSFEICDDIHWLHPGQSAYILSDNKKIGIVGIVHPSTLKHFQIKAKEPIIFELDLEILSKNLIPKYKKISKYPSISRDISFLVAKNISASDIINMINNLNIKILKNTNIFDVYQEQSSDKKSIALRMIFQDDNQTLNDQIVCKNIDKILNVLKIEFAIKQKA